ncbi:hypothetical protein JW935_23010 [candidate division KSB1 bacterium]|nr:hypothetical protein [candidate division KSB1 bacterium]
MPANNPDLISFEYQYLYDEIKGNSQHCANIFTISITVTASLIGYGISSGIWGIFLAPFVLLIPALYFLSSQMESTIKSATYIYVFIEQGNKSISWETDWLQLRQNGLVPSNPMGKYTVSISGLYGFISFLCLGLAWIYLTPRNLENIILLSSMSVFISILMFIVLRTIIVIYKDDFIQKYIQAWQVLKQLKENKSQADHE